MTAVKKLAVAELFSFTTLSSFLRMEAEHHKDLDLGVGGLEVGEDEARTEVRAGDDVDQTGHQHPVQVEPELLVQEILSRILNRKHC